MKKILLVALMVAGISGCNEATQEKKDRELVQRQQSQYAVTQPIPVYDWSLERHLLVQLYDIRNLRAATHSVWRSDRGMVEGDCPSVGFGIPYDTSLTNPLQSQWGRNGAATAIEQAEPNGVFASKNTAATWVMCANDIGVIEPVYIETKVTVYPYSVKVDYQNNRVTKFGKSSVTINTGQ